MTTEPRRRALRDPVLRERFGDAAAHLLGVALASMAILSVLIIWHLIRRGRLLRERLAPPRAIQWPPNPNPAPPEPGPRRDP